MTEEQASLMLQTLTEIKANTDTVITYNELTIGLICAVMGLLMAGVIAIILAVMLKDV